MRKWKDRETIKIKYKKLLTIVTRKIHKSDQNRYTENTKNSIMVFQSNVIMITSDGFVRNT